MRRFELTEDKSSKFWEIDHQGTDLHIHWGRIGTAGQSQTKTFADEAKASAAYNKLIAEKTRKGYQEKDAVAAPAPQVAKKAKVTPVKEDGHESTPAAPQESLDAQCQRVFVGLCEQIVQGVLAGRETRVTFATLRRQYAAGQQAVQLAVQQLESLALLRRWGSDTVGGGWYGAVERATALLKQWESTHGCVAATLPPTQGAPAENPPWVLSEPTPQVFAPLLQAAALASRRFPQPVPQKTAAVLWHKLRREVQNVEWSEQDMELSQCDDAQRAAMQRLFARLQEAQPAPDTEADALLLALGLSSNDREGELAETTVHWLVACYGLLQAVDVWLAAQRVTVEDRYFRSHDRRLYQISNQVDEPLRSSWYGPIGLGEAAMRRHLAHAAANDDALWRNCVARIEAALPGLHPERQPLQALLLPDWPELSNTLAQQWLSDKNAPASLHWLLLTATDPAIVQTLASKTRNSYDNGFWSQRNLVATVLQECGTQAVELLALGAQHDVAGEALTTIGTPEAVAALAKVASSSKIALTRLQWALERWPLAGMAGLAQCVAAGGKEAALLTPLLIGLLRTHAKQVAQVHPWLSPSAQGCIDRLLTRLNDSDRQVAEEAEWPEVLRVPPWQAKVKKKAIKALELQPLELAAVEQWSEDARATALECPEWLEHRQRQACQDVWVLLRELNFNVRSKKSSLPDALAQAACAAIEKRDAQALIEAWRKQLAAARAASRYFYGSLNGYAVTFLPPELAVPFWNAVAGEVPTYSNGASHFMTRFGLPALQGLHALLRAQPIEHASLALHFGAVELAASMARAFSKLKSVRETARRWLLKYPEHAACALLAPALGKAGEARDCAGAALRLLHSQGHEALLWEVAARYDDANVVQALRAVLQESPLDRFPNKIAPLPDWWQPHNWSAPLLINGKALPEAALTPLGQMMGFPTHEGIYAGITQVKQACQEATLADFSWDAFTAWLASGAASKENWALTTLGMWGNDDTARRLTPLLRTWPGEAAHARAVLGLDVLASIGTDVALMQLHGIAQKLKFKGLQDKAREKIQSIAEARGLSTEELEDRLVPDLGLDERGTLPLDFGPRAFIVGFDESLKPYVKDDSGVRLPDLPKPKKTDDAQLAKAATERFKSLKKDARTIASQQVQRLEVAMCSRRRWTQEVFQMFLVQHPLMRHLVQRLVWGTYSQAGALQSCFRVAEDDSFTTAEDDAFTLPEGEDIRIGIPHALELPAADTTAFSQLFADYELLQPFVQLGRDTYTLTDAEKAQTKLLRWVDNKVPTGRVLGLVHKGWRRGAAQDGGCIWYFTKAAGPGQVIELPLEPGIIVGLVDEDPEQTLGALEVGKPHAWGGGMQSAQTWGTLDAIVVSELIRDMQMLCA